jgi:hypothetical protein
MEKEVLEHTLNLANQRTGHNSKVRQLQLDLAKMSKKLHAKNNAEKEMENLKASMTTLFEGLKMQVFPIIYILWCIHSMWAAAPCVHLAYISL